MAWGENLHAPIMRVTHAELQRFGESEYRSVCPRCEAGVLLLCRSTRDLSLLRADRCTYCAQLVWYDDEAAPCGERFFEPREPMPGATAC